MVALLALRPERNHGFKRRAARQRATNFRDQNRRVLREHETRARPRRNAVEGAELVGTLPDGSKHLDRGSFAAMLVMRAISRLTGRAPILESWPSEDDDF